MKKTEFNALKDEWYERLKDSGFEDLENDHENLIKHSSSFYYRNKTQQKEEYYRLAGFFLHDHYFSSTTEKLIWQRHQDGVSIREILNELKDMRVKTNKDYVNSTIKGLAVLMVERYKDGLEQE